MKALSLFGIVGICLMTAVPALGGVVVLINEVDADQVGTDAAEFVELYDGGVGNTALTGLVLVFYNGNGDASYRSFDLDGESTNGQGYFVLCGDAANVPNCDLDVSPSINLLQNGAEAVALYFGDASDFPNGTLVTTTNLLDAIVYDVNDPDDDGLLVLLNAGQPQVDECGGAGCTTDSNQRCPDGSGGARNTDTYVQAIPTPGQANSCGAVGACCDESTGDCTEDETEASCVAAGNRFGGDGSTCLTIAPPCVALPTGACCDDSTGDCTEEVTEDSCNAAGNRYGGDGSDCFTINPPCVPPPTGACCSAGFCGDDVTQAGCETDGGTYQGDDSECPLDCGPESTVVINEIRIDQPQLDDDEYFELTGDSGASLDGLTYIVIGDSSGVTGGSGIIEAIVNLSGHSLDGSGLFLVAEATFGLGVADLVTTLNFENSDNVTHLLVVGFTGSLGDDLDTGGPCTEDEECEPATECIDTDDDDIPDTCNSDGVLDSPPPWAGELDRIALVEEPNPPSSTEYHYGPPSVGPDGPFVPGHAFRCDGADQWFIGGFTAGTDDTPGLANPSCIVTCTGGVLTKALEAVAINEIRTKQPGADTDEYFELTGDPFVSLDGVAYVVIGNSGTDSGVVEEVVCIDGELILDDGFLAVGEESFFLGEENADVELPDGDLNFFDGDDPRTHLLVLNFDGSLGQDLDTNDDGTFDVALPWETIIDDVALRGEDDPCIDEVPCIYSDTIVGPDVVELPDDVFSPAHVYRCDPDLTWTIGAFDPEDPCAVDTPGAMNESCDFVPPCGCDAAGSCFEANGTPNCDDEACCNTVCGIDPTCCELPDGWDQDCADLAADPKNCEIFEVQQGDLVFGLSNFDAALTLELLRGPAEVDGGGVVSDSWDVSFLQSMEFDNLDCISHNNSGNLLGVNFGPVGTGGTIHSLATCGPTNNTDQFIGNTQGLGGPGIDLTRLVGLSVSPDNTKIAVTGYDSQKVIVYDYTAGNCEGEGASLSGARQTEGLILCETDTQGTAWLDDDTVLVFAVTGEIIAVDADTMASEVVATVTVVGENPCDGTITDIEYNPQISPHVYAMYGDFDPDTATITNLLFVLDPADSFNLLVDPINYSTSFNETISEIAFDADGNLYVGEGFGGSIDVILDAVNFAALVDNDSLDWYTSKTFSFVPGLDVAIGKAGSTAPCSSCSGDCCDSSGNGAPGCNDDECCNLVCGTGGFESCCDVEWTAACATQAQEVCSACVGCGSCPTDGPVSGPDGEVGPADLGWVLGSWGPFVDNPQCQDEKGNFVGCPADLVCLDDLDPIPSNQDIGPEEIAKITGSWGPCNP